MAVAGLPVADELAVRAGAEVRFPGELTMADSANSTTPTAKRWTYAEVRALGDDGIRRELLDGALWVQESPNVGHQYVVMRLATKLRPWILAQKLGEFFIAPLDVVLAEDVSLQPDALFIRADRTGALIRRVIEGPPDLVIEVLSETNFRHDLLRKRRLYARHGIGEYWIVDPEQESVTVLSLSGEAYRDNEAASGEQPIPTAALPGLPIVAADLFRD